MCKRDTNNDTATILPIVKHLYRRYMHDAIKRGKQFLISIEYFDCLIVQPCAYCGVEMDNCYTQKQYAVKTLRYNGVDRIDSSGDYTTDNTVACCGKCNAAKSNRDEYFLSSAWIARRRDAVRNVKAA